ncbi:ribosome hibernation-promoting factor, HPF/YfiA family [Suttonella ornithocola]|uniref:Ribosome hibernation promoting factor n=1 Tax=Suttonella ornithocola TaxID=279832 RepID=A0A380MXD4_9GAMM|nr:ribosome-associated translation inhibitor RaiA [Suttonella ornithocola]SUO96942.1 ribosome hibernation promoting factor HPF [Suttonella ornithocola]
MQFNLTGKHLDISDAMREHIDHMLSRIEQIHAGVTSAQVTLQIEKHEKIAEATLHVANGKDIHGDARHTDMYAAIDGLEEKLIKQLQKLKEKAESH